ncbi:MAG: universal stress protein [Gammaproteobacteria bacterium]
MQRFHNILFVSQGLTDETEALKQALSFARNNKAELHALIVCPEFPSEMSSYIAQYESSLIEALQKNIDSTRQILGSSESDLPVEIKVESGSTLGIRIIQTVIKNQHDLVIKQAELKEDNNGFKAIDLELLRKCPAPVWLCRPITKHRNQIKVAVAIDPEGVTAETEDLSVNLLKLSRALADTCEGELNILSCWEYEFEEHLRQNVWVKVEEQKLIKLVSDVKDRHRQALDNLIQSSNIKGKIKVHHTRGAPDQIIPEKIKELNIDILLMGTVARTGISGFFIGNTAENVIQKLNCSLLALKPAGFISPVKAY